MLFDKPDVKLRKFVGKTREEAIQKAASLKKLTENSKSGWIEFAKILEDYCDKALKRKALTALDRATDKEIREWQLLDHEIWFIKSFILEIPMRYVNGVETAIKKDREKEKNEE